jgi:hypothetical protein
MLGLANAARGGRQRAERFSPDDAEGAAAAILPAMSDTDAGERGRRQAASFSWARAARETLAVYERVLR